MSCDVGELTERLENEHSSQLQSQQSSFSNLSFTSPTSQLILQPFRRFTYVTAHSPTLPLLHLRHSSFSNPSFASRTSQALHLIHLASRPCDHQYQSLEISVHAGLLVTKQEAVFPKHSDTYVSHPHHPLHSLEISVNIQPATPHNKWILVSNY